MSSFWRRVRGVAGTAVIWGAAWFTVALGWTGFTMWGLLSPGMILGGSLAIGVAGVISGTGFAVALGIAGRRSTLDELRYLKVAALGALGGIVVWAPILLSEPMTGVLPVVGIVGFLGAISSAGTLAIARAGRTPEAVESATATPALGSGGGGL